MEMQLLLFQLPKLKSRVNLSANLREQHGINVIDEAQYTIQQRTIGSNLRYSYRYKDIFDMSLSAQLSRQRAAYEFDQPDQKFFNQTYTAESNLTFAKKYVLSASFEYLVYDSKSANFHQAIPLLNLSLSRFVLKNNSGEIKAFCQQSS